MMTESKENIVSVEFTDATVVQKWGLWQYDYGQVLQILGLELPEVVQVHFSIREDGKETLSRVGIASDGITKVEIPNELMKNDSVRSDYNIYAYIYVSDSESGNTKYEIILHVKSRPSPGDVSQDPEEKRVLDEIVEQIKQSATRAEESEQNASESASKAEKTVESIENEKQSALQAIDERLKEAEGTISESEKNAVLSVEQAENTGIEAIQKEIKDWEQGTATDKTLSEEGKAADAASTGKMLNEKANGAGITFSINESGGLRVTYNDGR